MISIIFFHSYFYFLKTGIRAMVDDDEKKDAVVVGYLYILFDFVLSDPGFMFVRGSNKASKTIDPPGKPEGNAAHKVHCTVSPEIVLMGGYNTHVFVA
jgi:hypothetical protein